ncbi:transcriptional regulator FtsR [Phytohabitans kaempferiae]|uniref:MerR family transcriptional regulator n=1 Tax=Phytohabitans kaempferiae TaxID=1620943 RepID=A0ABV6MGB9_9ACTN
MSIGEVLAELRAEFPDTTISKLRFLEAEGLVEPRRTPAGYRKYSWDDIARLRFVLSAQRDQYLPLRVIREQLASRDAAPVRLVAVGSAPEGDSRLTRDELVARSGLDVTTLGEVERLGLLAPIAPGRYDADALAVATAVAGLAAFGLEPRHLRAYRAAADREVGLFTQLLAPLARQNDPAARARADQTAADLARLSQQLHAALVRAGLRDALGR